MRGIVYGKTFKSAERRFEQIIKDYQFIGIELEKINRLSYQINATFKNGDYWLATGATDSCRGRACNIAYIDCDISPDIIQCVILPTVKQPPFQGIHYY